MTCDASARAAWLCAMVPAEGGAAGRIQDALAQFGLPAVAIHRARGALPGCPLDRRGIPIWQEMLILEAVVPAEQAEAAFRTAFDAGGIGIPESGVLLMGRLSRASRYAISSRDGDPAGME